MPEASAPSAINHRRRRLDAGFVEQGRELHAGPFRAGQAGHGSQPRPSWRRASAALSAPLLPAHSMKAMRDSSGSASSASRVNTSGRFTRPWITSRCWSGSMSGMPEWLRSKCSPARRDHAVEQMLRRARGADALRRRIGRRRDHAPDLLEARRLAVGIEAPARLLHPARHRERFGKRARHAPARRAHAKRTFEK